MTKPFARALTLFAAAVLTSALPLTAQKEGEGSWTAELEDGRVQLALFGPEFGIWGVTFALADLRGLSDSEVGGADSASIAFRLEREPGVYAMRGTFQRGRGEGRYQFLPNHEFAAMLRSLDIRQDEPVTRHKLMAMAFFGDVSSAQIRELVSMRFEGLTLRQVLDIATHGVTPDYVRSMRSLGVAIGSGASGIIEMRTQRVTPDYVRELQRLGYRALTPRQLARMRLHGVTPSFIRQLRDAGVRRLSPEELTRRKIQGSHGSASDAHRDGGRKRTS